MVLVYILCRLRANLHFTLWTCMADESSNVHADTITLSQNMNPGNALRHHSTFQYAIRFGNIRLIITRMRGTLQLQLMALCHSKVTLMKSTDINITETTYSCQFQYEFGNQ